MCFDVPIWWCALAYLIGMALPFILAAVALISIVAVIIRVFTHSASRRATSVQTDHPAPKKASITLVISISVGILIVWGLCNWLFTDPSIPKFRPSRASIVGQWSPDAFSLENMQRDGGYTLSTHTLTFHDDGTFEMINMPDWWLSADNQSHRGFYSGSGTWQIEKWQGYWVVQVRFTSLTGYPDGLITYFTIGDWDGKRTIYYQISESAKYLVSFTKQ